MRHHATAGRLLTAPWLDRRAGARLVRFIVDRFLLLPIGAAVALVWANTAAESYFAFAHPVRFWVNGVGMAFFLGLLTQEVMEASMPGGALHTWRRWSLPIVAAAGGIAGAAAAYIGFINWKYELVLAPAWPVAVAVDVAAAYYLIKMIAPRSGAIPFVLVIGIVTTAFGLLVTALWPPLIETRVGGAALLLAAVGLAAILRRQRVRSFWPYLAICGSLSWLGLYWEGIHPALALVPIVPFLPHEPRPLELFAEPPDDDAVHHVEHEWNDAVQVVLFFFGLVNAGVILREYDTGTWAVIVGALVGRPVGLLAAVGLALLLGWHLPRRVGWRELVVVALATSGGFTFALFFAAGLLPVGGVLEQVKLGALATAFGALAAFGAARLLGVGRFGAHHLRAR